MSGFFQCVATNAVLAAGLAVLVAVLAPCLRRPALRHALWLLVLLKLLTPPGWILPLSAPDGWGGAAAPARPRVAATVAEPATREGPALALALPPAASAPPVARAEPGRVAATITSPPLRPTGAGENVPARSAPGALEGDLVPRAAAFGTEVRTPPPGRLAFFSTPRVLALLWAAGAVVLLALAGWRARRFSRMLARAGTPDPALQAEADRMANDLGLKTAPRVLVVAAVVPPLLWAPGRRAAIVLPAPLLAALTPVERATLLAHELAHFARRDHRLRWFDGAAGALFWWHPAAWWARRELRRAEEDCCDAWVLRVLPAAARDYAQALLKTLEFLAPPAAVRPPAGACAIGPSRGFRQTHSRLRRILTLRATPQLSRGQAVLVFALALAVLPLSARFVQAQSAAPEPRAAPLPAAQPHLPPPAAGATADDGAALAEKPARATTVAPPVPGTRAPTADDTVEPVPPRDEFRGFEQPPSRAIAGLPPGALFLGISVDGKFWVNGDGPIPPVVLTAAVRVWSEQGRAGDGRPRELTVAVEGAVPLSAMSVALEAVAQAGVAAVRLVRAEPGSAQGASVPPMPSGVITVHGEVRHPGRMPLPSGKTLTLAQAVLDAGGLTQWGDPRVKVIRKPPGADRTTLEVNLQDVWRGDAAQDLVLQPGDTVVVEQKWIAF